MIISIKVNEAEDMIGLFVHLNSTWRMSALIYRRWIVIGRFVQIAMTRNGDYT
jgi:hypothetical protein